MTEQVNRHDKRMSTAEEYMKEKKVSDIIYGYYQLHSHYEKGVNYCYKKDCTYAKIETYFKENALNDVDKKAPVSAPTLSKINKLLIKGGFIQQGKINGKSVYILPPTNSGYVWVKYDTLEFLVRTCQPSIIKIYTYLKDKYEQKRKNGQQYWFTKKQLCEVLGYSATNWNSYELINMILDILINIGLLQLEIKYHKDADYNPIPNYIVVAVNENYVKNEVVHRYKGNKTTDIKVQVPVDPEPIFDYGGESFKF